MKKPWMDQDLITLFKRTNNLYDLYWQGVVSCDIFTNFRNKLTNTNEIIFGINLKVVETIFGKLFSSSIFDVNLF